MKIIMIASSQESPGAVASCEVPEYCGPVFPGFFRVKTLSQASRQAVADTGGAPAEQIDVMFQLTHSTHFPLLCPPSSQTCDVAKAD